MGFKNITDLITTQVAATMATNSYVARYDNDPRATPTDPYWVRVSIAYGQDEQIELGTDSLYRGPGILTMQVIGPIEVGTGVALEMADILAAVFRNITLGGNVRFKTPRIENVGRIGDNWNINVICPFEADEN